MQLLPGRLAGARAASPQLLGEHPDLPQPSPFFPVWGRGTGNWVQGGCPAPRRRFGVLLLSSILSGAQEPPCAPQGHKALSFVEKASNFRVLDGVWGSRRPLRLRCAEAVGLRVNRKLRKDFAKRKPQR